MLNHSDSTLAALVGAMLAVMMFGAGWMARSLLISDLPICERIVISDSVGVKHEFEVCK